MKGPYPTNATILSYFNFESKPAEFTCRLHAASSAELLAVGEVFYVHQHLQDQAPVGFISLDKLKTGGWGIYKKEKTLNAGSLASQVIQSSRGHDSCTLSTEVFIYQV